MSTLLNTSTVRPDGHPQYTIAGEDADPASLIYTTLPNNLVFDTPVPYAFRSQPGNTTLKFKQDEAYKTALVNFFVIYTKRGGGDDPSAASGTDPVKVEFRALEVLLYLCVNSYNTVVTDGQSRTDVISSVSTVIITDDTDKPEIAKTQCVNPPSAEGGAGELHCLDTGDKDGNITLAGGSASAGVRSSSEPLADDRKFTSDILSLRQMTGSIVFSLFGQYERNDSSPVVTNMSSLWLWDALYGSYGNITDPEEQLSRAHEYYSGLATSLTNAYANLQPLSLTIKPHL